jgi:hypothetical protein
VAAVSALALALPASALGAEVALDVQIAGSGEGGVGCVVDGGPLEECWDEYEEGTELQIFAEPVFGSEFVSWGGECDSTSGDECQVEMDAAKTIEVSFDLEEFEVEIEVEGPGEGVVECEVNGGPAELCPENETYPYETELTLYAEEESGSEFVEWEGDCSGVEAECSLIVDEDLGVIASFAFEPPFELAIGAGGTGAGSFECEVNGGEPEACEEEYEEGDEVNVLAEPKPGSEFVEWNGDCDFVSGNECEVEMTSDKSVEAVFDLVPTYSLAVTLAGEGEGTVECEVEGGPAEECEAEYEEGTELTLVATPESGSTFAGFSAGTGSASGCSTSPCTFTIAAVSAVTATFDLVPTFELSVGVAGSGSGTVSSSPAGIDCGSTCSAEFEEGTEVTLTASAASDSTFSGYSGACSGTGPCVVTMDEARSVTATFEKNATPTPAPTPAPTPSAGRAAVAATAPVKSGKALLKLTCKGEGPCKGRLKLTAKVVSGKKTKKQTIGKAPFSLAAGATRTLAVKLSVPAKRILARGRILKAKATGSSLVSRTVKLKPKGKK